MGLTLKVFYSDTRFKSKTVLHYRDDRLSPFDIIVIPLFHLIFCNYSALF